MTDLEGNQNEDTNGIRRALEPKAIYIAHYGAFTLKCDFFRAVFPAVRRRFLVRGYVYLLSSENLWRY